MKDKVQKTEKGDIRETSSNDIKKKQPTETKKVDTKKTIKVKEHEYIKLVEEVAEYKDKYLRLFAEFDNVRKRFEREKIEFVKYANEVIITEFLGVVDNLERSVEAANTKHDDYAAFLKGIQMVMTEIQELLKRNNVTLIEAKDKKFDPNCHEILMQEETEDYDDEVVIEEFQKGYRLGEKVVRTAKVKVAVNTKSNN